MAERASAGALVKAAVPVRTQAVELDKDAERLLQIAQADAKSRGLSGADAEEVASAAMLDLVEKWDASRDEYPDPGLLLIGIVKKRVLRLRCERWRERPCGSVDSDGQTIADTTAVNVFSEEGFNPPESTRLAMEGRERLSQRWESMATAMAKGNPTPSLIRWVYETRRQRIASLQPWCLRFLTIAAEFEEGTPEENGRTVFALHGLPRHELEKMARRAAGGLSQWLHQHFPRRGACPKCGPGVLVFDCETHRIRDLLSVEGAPSKAEKRGPPGFRSWSGWDDPGNTGLPARHAEALQRVLHLKGRQNRMVRLLKARGWPESMADRGQISARLQVAQRDMSSIERELDQGCRRRYMFGDHEALRQHRLELTVRAFRLELCRLLRLSAYDFDTMARAWRKESEERTAYVIAEMKAEGEWPAKGKKGGRPAKRSVTTRRRARQKPRTFSSANR